jgi:hypothetical protein
MGNPLFDIIRAADSWALSVSAAVCLAPLCCGAAVAGDQVSVFAGRMVSNGWEDVFTEPGHLDWRESGVVGVAYGRDWPLTRRLSFGAEGQMVFHFGEQVHAEFNLPVYLRYSPESLHPLESASFGMGPSFATEVPEIEVETKGGSQRALLYWSIEFEFLTPRPDMFVYARLHHRSNVFGIVADEGGSNAVVIGLRRRW